MKRTSYKDLEAEFERAKRELDIYQTALMLSIRALPDAVTTVRFDGWSHRYELYGATRADGGVVVIISKTKGQADSITARRLDDLDYPVDRPMFRAAVNQLCMERLKLVEAAA